MQQGEYNNWRVGGSGWLGLARQIRQKGTPEAVKKRAAPDIRLEKNCFQLKTEEK